MMRRLSILIWIAAIGALAGAQYHVSYQAQSLVRQMHKLDRETLEMQENIRILEAEWAYINHPDRLRELAAKYLPLEPLKGAQLASFGEVPRAETQTAGVFKASMIQEGEN